MRQHNRLLAGPAILGHRELIGKWTSNVRQWHMHVAILMVSASSVSGSDSERKAPRRLEKPRALVLGADWGKQLNDAVSDVFDVGWSSAIPHQTDCGFVAWRQHRAFINKEQVADGVCGTSCLRRRTSRGVRQGLSDTRRSMQDKKSQPGGYGLLNANVGVNTGQSRTVTCEVGIRME